MSESDEKFMLSALALAAKGIGCVEPNPAVGCVIVKDGNVIGRGWHKKFGGPHAEINALADCEKNGENPRGAVMYVTLEPCCHQGKTGPCTEAIKQAGIARVVAAMIDPSVHAGGKGLEQLRQAGIEVEVGLCEEKAKLLNAPFIKFASTGKCWVVLKWAQTLDGKMAWADETDGKRWISNELSRKDAQKLRRRVGAILVGIETVLADDCLLTVRPPGKKPLRIVLDSRLRIPLDCKLMATAKETPVMVVTTHETLEANPAIAENIKQKGAEILAVPAENGRCDIAFLLDELVKRGIAQLLVEGGAKVLSSFLEQGVADEICVYIAPLILGKRGRVSISDETLQAGEGINLRCVDMKRFGEDVRIRGIVQSPKSKVKS
jgi:diaminohydroxyphosphoribosylaminopyrimidine deaminase/5-amino-6-(5-phosphoribosylamino)uracil reductase